ncbi:unnamed protein product [Lupinus luteus]|uniref:Uncharacterized protein n=1 Tax=Lupinus luteus TaxID=3873 RepID=A0AAV1WKT0_LUPLU
MIMLTQLVKESLARGYATGCDSSIRSGYHRIGSWNGIMGKSEEISEARNGLDASASTWVPDPPFGEKWLRGEECSVKDVSKLEVAVEYHFDFVVMKKHNSSTSDCEHIYHVHYVGMKKKGVDEFPFSVIWLLGDSFQAKFA